MTANTSWGTVPKFVTGDPGFAARVERRLAGLLTADRERYARIAPDSGAMIDALLTATVRGGKRLRPTLAFLAFLGAGGEPEDPTIVDVGAALELLHTGCLVHDDIMDASPTRRGRITTHTRYEQEHRRTGFTGNARRFGEGVATIVGDVAFFYAIGLLRDAGPEPQRVFCEMAVDVGVGQYLDLLGAACSADTAPDPATIARYKTGRYTVEGPLQLGAALAGRLAGLADVFTAYGRPVGLAYQLRDDLLGAFGDPAVTGKPVGDDLRQGKRTLLLQFAKQRAAAGSSGDILLAKAVGRTLLDAEVPALQQFLIDIGAHDHVRDTCGELVATAVDALEHADIHTDVKHQLRQFAEYVGCFQVS
ncbi:polyprenyl synthetase family protein [Amycolatopsis lurida]